jgi:acetyl-CoA carboxylase beta subunit
MHESWLRVVAEGCVRNQLVDSSRHPTTGGVMSSWASLGHIAVAEPGALLGFLGPRVYQALTGETFPA